jgi:transcriptional regulator with XRE-family HTH domain
MGRTRKPLAGAVAFGERVRASRVSLELSQMALAERVGLHFSYISSVERGERGERNVSLENILKLADGLEVDPADLVAGLQPTPP